MTQPTERQTEEARQYILRRLQAEQSMDYNLNLLIASAARQLVLIALRAGVPATRFSFDASPSIHRQVEEVIRKLREAILDALYTLACAYTDNEEEKNKILLYIRRRQYGSDLSLRLDRHLSAFRAETEQGIITAMAATLTLATAATMLSPGKGAQSALHTLTRHAVAEGWSYAWIREAEAAGYTAFLSRRGSSYPCAVCDGETTYIHTLQSPMPPYHPHCCCYLVPVAL